MPAETERQRTAAAIALHEPGKLFKRNRGLLSMDKSDLRDFARKKKASKLKKRMTER